MASRDDYAGQGAGTANDDGYVSPTEAPPALYVRALYKYTSDDHTSLSFEQGDIIQVLNQLETGWWDGVIGDVRGWFPSNYCAVVPGPEAVNDQTGDASAESGADDEYEDDVDGLDTTLRDEDLPLESNGADGGEAEEAAFWIPQATADGRLFYYNTLTGYSTMELPLETPTSVNESGPRDRTNVYVPEHTRLPPEMMARGIDRYEDDYDGSASEAEGDSLLMASQRRHSFISDGVSPATSLGSVNPSPITKHYDLKSAYPPHFVSNGGNGGMDSIPIMGTPMSSHSTTTDRSPPLGISTSIPRYFLDDSTAPHPTWNSLISNMRDAIDAYRQAIIDGRRSEYVRRAEDVSDHLRMLLAAGSDTTDNHSGNPSIISTNKALYPHFRDMMSKFSKLVLSSHIAAADWPGPDSASKCLHEAEGVLQGVYGYVEVAKQQRGDDIRRLTPGFVAGSTSGGHWQNNNLARRDPTSFLEHDSESHRTPSVSLDSQLLERIEELRKMLAVSSRRLEEQLSSFKGKIVTPKSHAEIGDAVRKLSPMGGAHRVYRPVTLWLRSPKPQLADFSVQKQRVYDSISDLVMSCQHISAPLGDEWAEIRGDSLETRLNNTRMMSRQLTNCVQQIGFSLTLLLEQAPQQIPNGDGYNKSTPKVRKSPPSSIGIPSSYGVGDDLDKPPRSLDKAQRFFGQPVPREPTSAREPEETPWFLKLDHEAEVFYDVKGDVQQLKCGTLAGLVEQLTRHDKLDPSFKDTFLLTYRSFTTASELFEMVVHRFTLQPPYGLSKAELQIWTEQKQIPIRIRVVNILKSWFENFWMEPNDEANTHLLGRIHSFVTEAVASTKTPGAQQLVSLIEQRLRGEETTAKRLVPTISSNAPTPITPKNMKKIKFLDIDPTEFARQLTIIESRLYAKIKPTECLNKTWQKKAGPGEAEPAPNVKALILHSNQLTNWVAEMILTQSDVRRRVVVIKHFVSVADKCRQLNNYSTLTSIISALGTAPIHRLARTWAQVSQKTAGTLEMIRKLMASTKNFGEYRETLHLANPPCIPFFGVYLTDLTFIEDGIPSLTQSDLINFNKRTKTAEVIRDIQQYQNAPYQLIPVPELQEYVLNNMQAAGDVHDMYERSLEIEPREREDEKIARYGKHYYDPSVVALSLTVGIH
ncbi:cell division control protein Cdc25 [Trichophyton tonsurans CBS 112818]|uniref:Cell division control protein Cdc25 n=1 Tax=Trichophyton tonsurans (strain CBS 112818) TaxID=647933 RepID=F2RZW1_TRIT1|nr:cell division control protein Cdc25 [Trichophyton tonsurans CBS 112818]